MAVIEILPGRWRNGAVVLTTVFSILPTFVVSGVVISVFAFSFDAVTSSKVIFCIGANVNLPLLIFFFHPSVGTDE